MLSDSLTHRIYSDLIDSILQCNQFIFKLITYCKKNGADDPLKYCKEEVMTTKNVTLVLRSDQKLWLFRRDFAELFIKYEELSISGRQALVLLVKLMLTVSEKDPYTNLVYMTDFRNVEFFYSTFISCLDSKLEGYFDVVNKSTALYFRFSLSIFYKFFTQNIQMLMITEPFSIDFVFLK